jgi:hypothetical protein
MCYTLVIGSVKKVASDKGFKEIAINCEQKQQKSYSKQHDSYQH